MHDCFGLTVWDQSISGLQLGEEPVRQWLQSCYGIFQFHGYSLWMIVQLISTGFVQKYQSKCISDHWFLFLIDHVIPIWPAMTSSLWTRPQSPPRRQKTLSLSNPLLLQTQYSATCAATTSTSVSLSYTMAIKYRQKNKAFTDQNYTEQKKCSW